MPGMVGNPAPDEHADGRGEQKGGEHRGGLRVRRLVQQVQRGDAEIADAVTGHGDAGEEEQPGEYRHAEEQLETAARHRDARARCVAPGVVEHARVERQQHDDHDTGRGRERDRGAPAERVHQQDDRDRRHRAAEIAGEGVDGEGPADPRLADAGVENRVVRRMIDGVGEPCEHHERDQRRVHRYRGDERHGERVQRETADQDAARAVAVDEESDRRLGEPSGDAEHGDREAELGEADAVDVAQERKQRRQQQHVEVAEEVPGADQADDPGAAAPARLGNCLYVHTTVITLELRGWLIQR